MNDDRRSRCSTRRRFSAAELRRDPYDYRLRRARHRRRDGKTTCSPTRPTSRYRGSYALPNLRYGPKFADCMEDLLSDRFRRLVEQKFDIDLSNKPPSIVMMGATSGAL